MMNRIYRINLLGLGVFVMLCRPIFGQDCAKTSVGLSSLDTLGTGLYKGYQGGFYPGGNNKRPLFHDSVGLAFARQVQPLSGTGSPDFLNGKIVLLSIGMSNATQEFSMFKTIADTDHTKNSKVLIVDGAQGGQTAAMISNPSAMFWTVVDQRLASAGVTGQQVQVAWVKEADASPTQSFPTHALTLQSEFEAIARILRSRFPNVKIAYWSSRTYGGYATTNLNPEPYAYESGFAVKWLIEKQINGDTSLSYSGNNPRAPWLAWGGYLWADGLRPRSDGLIWECADFQSDGTHPSTSGRLKVAQILLRFFKTDPTTVSWFLKSTATAVEKSENVAPVHFNLTQNYPNPFNPTTTIRFEIGDLGFVSLKVFDLLGREVATLVEGKLDAGQHSDVFKGDNLPSGVYFYRLQSSGLVQHRRMVLIR